MEAETKAWRGLVTSSEPHIQSCCTPSQGPEPQPLNLPTLGPEHVDPDGLGSLNSACCSEQKPQGSQLRVSSLSVLATCPLRLLYFQIRLSSVLSNAAWRA